MTSGALSNCRLTKDQSGAAMLEALVAILIISFGILGLIGLQATSINAATDARARSEASQFIDRLIGEMTVSVDRNNIGTSIQAFQHQPSGTCAAESEFSGAASSADVVSDWVDAITADGTGLAGVKPGWIQVRADPASNNQIQITVCWAPPQQSQDSQGETIVRRHTTIAYIN
jgi:type IV pilus assembly protein PilV